MVVMDTMLQKVVMEKYYDHNEILELYKLGYSVVQISEKYNVNVVPFPKF